jgi:hypothetical protein
MCLLRTNLRDDGRYEVITSNNVGILRQFIDKKLNQPTQNNEIIKW